MTKPERYDLAVYIGRFQPPCRHHIETIKHGLKIADKLLVFVGSANTSRSIKNPFTAEERIEMIRSVLSLEESQRVLFCKKEDRLYDDTQWVMGVEHNVNRVLDEIKGPVDVKKVTLIGCKSDSSSWYLDKFPGWSKEFVVAPHRLNDTIIHATDIRNALLCGSDWVYEEIVPHYCYSAVDIWLRKFRNTQEYKDLCEEFDMIRKYRDAWEDSPYPPTFLTADALVVKSGNILLVKRGANPGKGLYALPGGFVNQKERIVDAAIRELREETRIDVHPADLYKGIKKAEVFDHPDRSLRGRTVTHAFLIELRDKYDTLPWIKGGDDAAKAFWVPLSEIEGLRSQMFEDHWDIIHHMVGGFVNGDAPVIFGQRSLNR